MALRKARSGNNPRGGANTTVSVRHRLATWSEQSLLGAF